MRQPNRLVLVLALVLRGGTNFAQTPGLVPLEDLGPGLYEEFQGGLYPGGLNTPPPAHLAAALQLGTQITPRNAAGAPDPNGFIGMIAVGMSNTTHEFGAFEYNQDANPNRNARVVIVDTAFGGQTASAIANPAAQYWTTMSQRLAAMGLSAAQVQVAWLKEANAQPPDDFPGHATTLRDNLESIANNLHDKFPNLRLCYLSSRIYGGYAAPGSLNPEPQAYESGFSVKWLIEDQINGAANLDFGQGPGPVRAPLLVWGPYLWANGPTPRSDGLTWLPAELEADMTHPGPAAEQKVAGLLASFFSTDPTAASWWPRHTDAALVALPATDDATVSFASPGANFGAALQLLVQGGAQPLRSYARFDTTTVGRPALLAKLGARVASGAGGRVSLVAGTTWSQNTITWSNAPALGAALVEMPVSSKDGTIGANVTGAVNADSDGVLSFALSTAAAGLGEYVSSEGGQAPHLVVVVSCAGGGPPGATDSDGDGVTNACDCAPANATAFALPGETSDLRFQTPSLLTWNPVAPSAGSITLYDVMSGDLNDVANFGTGAGDTCVADGVVMLQTADGSPAPESGSGRFYLVRGENACGHGRYESASDGRDRATLACP